MRRRPGARRPQPSLTLDAVRRLLLREAREQPLLVIFEDLHWIDRETQAVLDALVEGLGSARLLLLVNYRPEYQQTWDSKTYYSQMRLDALPAESAEELLQALVGDDPGLGPLGGGDGSVTPEIIDGRAPDRRCNHYVLIDRFRPPILARSLLAAGKMVAGWCAVIITRSSSRHSGPYALHRAGAYANGPRDCVNAAALR